MYVLGAGLLRETLWLAFWRLKEFHEFVIETLPNTNSVKAAILVDACDYCSQEMTASPYECNDMAYHS